MNHRCGQRISTDRIVRIRIASGAVSIARLRDISVSGALLNTVLDLPYMSRVRVQIIRGYDGDGSTREIEAYVIRRTTEGTGIEWEELNPHAVDELIKALSHRPAAAEAARMPEPAVSRQRANKLPALPMAYSRLH